ncbi:MAG TPA: AzlD domain-containing protein [Burkholderiaceae bacterium]|jgi:branched-subunit amino acid transport protein|nr:AzlD domain-containing protein [Burkholderiaceae bacterium]
MSALEIWITIAGLTAVTFVTRNFFIAFGDALRLPPRVQHALRYAPACALAALIVPEVVLQQGALALNFGNDRLAAALAAIAVMLATRSMLATMATGVAAYLALQWV